MLPGFWIYKKRGDLHPLVSLTPRTWDIGGGTPAVTLRTWDMGGETPAENLSVHIYYMQCSSKMHLLFDEYISPIVYTVNVRLLIGLNPIYTVA